MDYKFTEIIDIPNLRLICEGLTQFNGTVTALLDLEGNVHIATGWRDICTKFHRVHPGSSSRCTESDTALAGRLGKGRVFNIYRCKNGLIDVAVPVFVGGEHVGNFFTGQFFLKPPDIDYFRAQAHEFGFDEQSYIEAVNRVPVFSEEHVRKTMAFLVELTQFIGEMGLKKLTILQSSKQNQECLERLVAQRTRELNDANATLELANEKLCEKNSKLTAYLDEIHALRGLIYICAKCKKIRDLDGYWNSVEKYLIKYPDATFSHGYCPECYEKALRDLTESE